MIAKTIHHLKTGNTLYILGLCMVTLIIGSELLLPWPLAGYDQPGHYVKLVEFDQNLTHRIFPAQWAPDVAYGLGYPVFIFYPQLCYWLAEPLYLLTQNPVWAINLTQLCIWFFSGAGLYVFLTRYFERDESFLAACIYCISPYRFIDVYGRAALAESTTFLVLTLLLISLGFLVDAIGRKKRDLIMPVTGTAFAWTALIISHIAIAYVAMLIAIAVTTIACLASGMRRLWLIIMPMALSSVLAAWYWVPLLAERTYIHADGLLNATHSLFADIGAFYLLASTGLAVLFVLLLPRLTSGSSPMPGRSRAIVLGISISIMLGTVVLMTPWADFLYRVIPGLVYLQFSWRLKIFWTLAFAVSSILVVQLLPARRGVAGFAAMLILLVVYVPRLEHRPTPYPDPYLALSPDTISSSDYQIMDEKTQEYITIWSTAGTPSYQKEKINSAMPQSLKTAATIREINPFHYELTLAQPHTGGVIDLWIHYYPGWSILQDNTTQPAAISDQAGLVRVPIDPADTTLHIQFLDTPVRALSKLISLLCFMTLIAGVLLQRGALFLRRS